MGVNTEDKIVMKRINEIRPYMRNPRQNQKTVELLCNLIPKVGFNVPIVIDEKGIIVKGHARFSAAIRLGMEEVPCIVTHADPDAVKVDRITDNKIAEYSQWMNEELEEEIESIHSDIDFSELGFPKVSFEGMPEHTMPSEAPQSHVEPFSGVEGKTDRENATNGSNKPSEGIKLSVPKKYYKCVCKDCGHVMFVEASKLAEG